MAVSSEKGKGMTANANTQQEIKAYTVIRSRRRTVALQVREDGSVIVRAPDRLSGSVIEAFVSEKRDWIRRQKEICLERSKNRLCVSSEQRRQGMERAGEVIARRTAYFADVMGVDYGRITIREQKTRWGSCSSAGNLNFNWKLILLSPEVLDYVVVHELAHRREMNHSDAFWRIVEQVLPDYRKRRKLLREVYL